MNKKDIKMLVLDVDGTLTDGGVYIMEDGRQFKKFNARDGLGIKMAIKSGIEVSIISHSHVKQMVETRAQMLGIKNYYIGPEEKLTVLNSWLATSNISLAQVAFVGDDLNDVEIMQHVGLAACPADAVGGIKSIAHLVLTKSGGDGAVREFIEYLLTD